MSLLKHFIILFCLLYFVKSQVQNFSCLFLGNGIVKFCWFFQNQEIIIRAEYDQKNSFFYQIITDEESDKDFIGILSTDPLKKINQNNLVLIDAYLIDQLQINDQELGGTNDLQLIEQSSQYCVFKRLLNTGDKYDKVYTENQDVYIQFTLMDSESQIILQDKIQFPFQNGYNGYGYTQWPETLLKKFHYWTNFVMWGILVDLGNCAARFFKTKKYYIQIHGYIMVLVCTSTFIVEILVLVKSPKIFFQFKSLSSIQLLHFLLGFIFMLLFVLQTLGGYALYLIFNREETYMKKYFYYYKLFHQVFGYMLYFCGKAGVITGFKLIENEYYANMCYYVFSSLVILRLCAEYVFIYKPNLFTKLLSLKNKQLQKLKDIEEKRINLISQQQIFEEIIYNMNNFTITSKDIIQLYNKMVLVLYDNKIYDIMKINHPGGNFLKMQVKGREIGRFMYGAFGLETTNLPPYDHSKYAYKMLDQYFIGEISNINVFSGDYNENMKWIIQKKVNLDAFTSIFYFKNENKEVVVNKVFKGMEWIGRHFVLNDSLLKKNTRQYTNCIAFSDYNRELRRQMFNNYINITQKKQENITFDISLLEDLKNDNIFNLVIKKYKSKQGFSQYIHENVDSFYIRGPYSRGLEISYKSKGLHVFICGGTGILPFYDLLDYFYKYMIYLSFKKRNLGDQINLMEEQYEQNVNQELKLQFLMSFNNVDESYESIQLVNQMMQIEKENNLNVFSCIIRVSNNLCLKNSFPYIEQCYCSFNKQFLNKNIKANNNVNRIYICGPPNLNKNVYQNLLDLQVNELDMVLV